MDQPAANAAPARALHNLPAALTPFVGRDAECAQVIARLRQPSSRLLTITGAGGVGKTRLALQAAQALIPAPGVDTPFVHGVYLAPLATLGEHETPGDVLAATLVSALGIALAGPEPPAAQVIQYLREKMVLLLVDNLEHVSDGLAFITSLLQASPALKIVVTSRQRLSMRGEQVIELVGLPFPAPGQPATLEAQADYAAIDMFVQSAQALQPDFALSAETAPAVARICQLVEGLPLGIELAAAWIRVLSCDEIAQEIGRNLDFLSSAMHDLPARQRSLRAVFDYSWNLLSEPEQQALRQLAVFRGSFTREAATAVLRTESKGLSDETLHSVLSTQSSVLLTLLAALVDKSLVRRVTTEGVPRYEILELLRQYLTEHLAHAGEADAAATRHSAYYCAWMGARTAELRGKEQGAALAAIGREIEQIRAAWRCGVANADSAALGNAADSLCHFYDMRSWFHEGAEAFGAASQALAAQPDVADQLVYGKLLARLGWFTFYLGRQSEAKTLFDQSLAILRRLDARADMVFTLNYLGAVCSYLGDYTQTRALCRESLVIAEALGDDYGRAIACNILGQTAYEGGGRVRRGALVLRAEPTNARRPGRHSRCGYLLQPAWRRGDGAGQPFRGWAALRPELGAGARDWQPVGYGRIAEQPGPASFHPGARPSRDPAAARGAAPCAGHPGRATGRDDHGRAGADRAACWAVGLGRRARAFCGRRAGLIRFIPTAGRTAAQLDDVRHSGADSGTGDRRGAGAAPRGRARDTGRCYASQSPRRPDRARDRGAAAGSPGADRRAGGREVGAQPADRQHAPDIDLWQAGGQLAQRRHTLRGGEWPGVTCSVAQPAEAAQPGCSPRRGSPSNCAGPRPEPGRSA